MNPHNLAITECPTDQHAFNKLLYHNCHAELKNR